MKLFKNLLLILPFWLLLILQATAQVPTESDISLPTPDVSPELASDHAQLSVLYLITGAGVVVKIVLLTLVIMSVVTWAIVVSKYLHFRRSKKESEKFSDVFWASRNLAQINESTAHLRSSPLVAVYAAGYRELTHIVRSNENNVSSGDGADLDSIERALKRAKAEEITGLEKGSTFLATAGSTAPFIGLLGTVWGIMDAFIGLSGAKSTSIQAVAPGIAEALITTAVGLGAAIPAYIAYSYFAQQVKVLSRNMDMFSAEFLNIARRHFLK
jgi:biopolymer transport protein TolQ